MTLRTYHVEAFTAKLFGGNPAAVVPLAEWLPERTMQAIAAENNLSETAFLVRGAKSFELRWFTPTVEVDLCGHATLAAAFVLYERLGYEGERIDFTTKSGSLSVTREGELLWLDFPARPPEPVRPHPLLLEAMRDKPEQVLAARDYLLVYPNADAVRSLTPDMTKLSEVSDRFATIVTAPGDEWDFVSRFFAPRQGIPEDPATGSAHCTLIPYWANRLGKTRMRARQLSARGGELECELLGERVRIGGRATLYLEGEIYLP